MNAAETATKTCDVCAARHSNAHNLCADCAYWCDGNLAEAHNPPECECDNTHDQNDTVCMWCWVRGRRAPADPEIVTA